MKYLYAVSIIGCFVLLGIFCLHSFDSINNDIGRHIKLGEIIWQTKSIPSTNLFSYTELNHSFINHHWLSEVLFYFSYSLIGLKGMIVLKTIVILVSFLVLQYTLQKILALEGHSGLIYPISCFVFILSTFVIYERTEVRPEVFSFLFFSIFLSILLKEKYVGRSRLIWILPVLELLWVNSHIYFFIGPLLVLFFAFDTLINNKSNRESVLRLVILVCLTGLATLINPNGIVGALYPLNVFKEYGYSVAENQSPFFLAQFGPSVTIKLFELSLFILIGSLAVMATKFKNKLFEFMLAGFLIFAGVKMVRNFSIFSLGMYPIIVLNVNHVLKKFKLFANLSKRKLIQITLYCILIILTSYFSLQLITNRFYVQQWSNTKFGLEIPVGGEGGVNFIKTVGLKGPLFNNFNLGSYLIWKLYPGEKVFVDSRPEAYSELFFKDIYVPMQEDNNKWKLYQDKFKFNYIIFDYSDSTPWAQTFLQHRFNDKDWLPVYADQSIILFIRNTSENVSLVRSAGHEIVSAENILDEPEIEGILSSGSVVDVLSVGELMFIAKWYDQAISVYEVAKKMDSSNPYTYLGLGYVYSNIQTLGAQKLAVDNLEKAINLGLKTANNFVLLGLVRYNTSDRNGARTAWQKALDLDPGNQDASSLLVKTSN